MWRQRVLGYKRQEIGAKPLDPKNNVVEKTNTLISIFFLVSSFEYKKKLTPIFCHTTLQKPHGILRELGSDLN